MSHVITRIVGNALPPRDTAEGKLKAIEFVLRNEDPCVFQDKPARKVWIINRVFHRPIRDRLAYLFETYGHPFFTIPFDFYRYCRYGRSFKDKVREAVHINQARNYGLLLTRPYSWNFLLDDSCFFNKQLWDQTIGDMQAQLGKNPNQQYFGVPMIRINNEIPANYESYPRWEPTIAFSDKADQLFDESIPFGDNDKVELLRRLGYNRAAGQIAVEGDMCSNAGSVLHISFDSEENEVNLGSRMEARRCSLVKLVDSLDRSK